MDYIESCVKCACIAVCVCVPEEERRGRVNEVKNVDTFCRIMYTSISFLCAAKDMKLTFQFGFMMYSKHFNIISFAYVSSANTVNVCTFQINVLVSVLLKCHLKCVSHPLCF